MEANDRNLYPIQHVDISKDFTKVLIFPMAVLAGEKSFTCALTYSSLFSVMIIAGIYDYK